MDFYGCCSVWTAHNSNVFISYSVMEMMKETKVRVCCPLNPSLSDTDSAMRKTGLQERPGRYAHQLDLVEETH